MSAGTELDYDGGSLFINATITLLNLQHNTLIGNLKLRSNISHAPAKLDVAKELRQYIPYLSSYLTISVILGYTRRLKTGSTSIC